MSHWVELQIALSNSLRMKRLWSISILLLGLAQVKSENIDLGVECQEGDSHCSIVWPTELCNDDRGFILSPHYPDSMKIPAEYGTYDVLLRSCEGSYVVLTLSDGDGDGEFSLQSTANSFYVGDGDVVGSHIIPPPIKGPGDDSSNLPNGGSSYNYTSKSNHIWMRAKLSQVLRVRFKIEFSVIKSQVRIYCLKDASGSITSPDFGASYPKDDIEVHYFINVTEVSPYHDLLFTVDVMDINGGNGDYIKIGKGVTTKECMECQCQGMDYLSGENSALLSWQLPKGEKFLIEGNIAHLIFQAIRSTDQPNNEGFNIAYETIGKRPTLAPSTTQPTTEPTPLPFDPTVLQQTVVFLRYNSSQSYAEMLDILTQYTLSSIYPSEGDIQPPLSKETVLIGDVVPCYHGWDVDLDTCRKVNVQVHAFFVPYNQEEAAHYALTGDQIRDAVSQYDSNEVKLVDDLRDVYSWSLGFSLAMCILVMCFISLVFFIVEKVKNPSKVAETDYSEVGETGTKKGKYKKQKYRASKMAFDNPTYDQSGDMNEQPDFEVISQPPRYDNKLRDYRGKQNNPTDRDEDVLYEIRPPTLPQQSYQPRDFRIQMNYPNSAPVMNLTMDNMDEIQLDNLAADTHTSTI